MRYNLIQITKRIGQYKIVILILLLIISIFISLNNYYLGSNFFWGGEYTFYNNYVIFKNSFFHLIENKNLYILYPNEYADRFKYSPSFALFMSLFAYIPNWIGLLCWNALNVLILYLSLNSLKHYFFKNVMYVYIFILLELILSLQCSQANLIITGLTIMTFNNLEKDKPEIATFLIVLGSFIKLFSLTTCLLILLYPKKMKSFLFLFLWFIIIGILPLFIINSNQLYTQYLNWGNLLLNDHNNSLGLSIYQYIVPILPSSFNKIGILIWGFVILCFPLLFLHQYSNPNYRITYLCFLLIWVVIFNHRAESPTYIIAMTGSAIWWLNSKKSLFKNILLALTFVLTSLRITDLIPNNSSSVFFNWIYIKPLMTIVIFFLIFYSFFKITPSKTEIIIEK